MLEPRREFYISPREVGSIAFDAQDYEMLSDIGINIPDARVNSMIAAAMDAIQPSVTTASVPTPVQFLQNWLPGFVNIITKARNIDRLVGVVTSGAWEDEQVVQSVMEYLGNALPYGDYSNVNYSDWNVNFEEFTNVRFEIGMLADRLEIARSARINVDTAASKRNAATQQLEIIRNYVGFFGYNSGNNRTYGFLNAPQLPAYVAATTGAASFTLWSTKTYLEIVADIRQMIIGVRTSSGDTIDPETTNMTLALPTTQVDYLSVVSQFGNSVRDWMTETYPRIRVVSAPELTAANGGANVAYLYAEQVSDMASNDSTDDNKIFVQVVPSKFYMLGVEQKTKGYKEDYSNATAGVFCKRPWAVYRLTGI